MSYTTYNEIPGKLFQKRSFKGSSSKGKHRNGSYVVTSYDTDILIIDGPKFYFDYQKYSKVTSRLQNIIKRILPSINTRNSHDNMYKEKRDGSIELLRKPMVIEPIERFNSVLDFTSHYTISDYNIIRTQPDEEYHIDSSGSSSNLDNSEEPKEKVVTGAGFNF